MNKKIKQNFLTRKSKKIKYEDGKNEVNLFSSDRAYKDKDDVLQPINTEPTNNTSCFVNSTNSIKPKIFKDPQTEYNIVYETDFGLKVSFDLRNFKYLNSSTGEEEVIASPKNAENYVEKNSDNVDTIIQSQVNEDIVDIFEIFGGKVKRSIYLEKKPTNSTIDDDKFEVSHKIKTNNDVEILVDDVKKTESFITSKGINFSIDGIDDKFRITKPILFDSNKNYFNIEYKFEFISNDEFKLSFIFNSDVLNQVTYPLIIDPSSTVDSSTESTSFSIPYSQTVNWECNLYRNANEYMDGWEEYWISGDKVASTKDYAHNGEHTFSGNKNLDSGNHTHEIQYHDFIEVQTNTYGTVTYYDDTTAPTISVDNEGTDVWTSENQSVTITVADGESGVANVYYDWNDDSESTNNWSSISNGGTTTQINDGVWYLHVKAEDNAGNVNINHYGPYKIDSDTSMEPCSAHTHYDYSDHPVTDGSCGSSDFTPHRAVHWDEIEEAINRYRTHYDLSTINFSDENYGSKSKIDKLRQEIDEINKSGMDWTDPNITAGSISIRAIHMNDLRNNMYSVEDKCYACHACDAYTCDCDSYTGCGSCDAYSCGCDSDSGCDCDNYSCDCHAYYGCGCDGDCGDTGCGCDVVYECAPDAGTGCDAHEYCDPDSCSTDGCGCDGDCNDTNCNRDGYYCGCDSDDGCNPYGYSCDCDSDLSCTEDGYSCAACDVAYNLVD